MADSTFVATEYAREVSERCPTAADSLGPAFYARSLYYNGLEDRDKAIVFGRYALEQFQQADTTLQLGKTTYNLGFFHLRSGDNREALQYFKAAAKIYPLIDHPESPRRWLQSLEDLGYTYSLLGDYQNSEATLLYARDEATRLGNDQKLAHINLKLGEQYEKYGDLGAAAGALEAAVAGFAELGDEGWYGTSRIGQATLWRRQGKQALAYRTIKSVLKRPEVLSGFNLARAYSLALLLALGDEDIPAATSFFAENLIVAQRVGDPRLEAQAWDNGGEAALKANNPQLAIERFTTAVGLLVPGYTLTEETPVPTGDQVARSPYHVNLLTYLGDLARAFRAAGQPEDALAALRAADQAADQLRAGLGGEQSALFWRGKALPVYEQAIELCHELERPDEAFFFFEKSRAILLLEALAEADLIGQLPREVASTLARGQQDLLGAQRALLAAGEGKEDSLQLVLTQNRETLLELRDSVQQQFPGLLPEGRITKVIDLSTAQQNLTAAGIGRQLQYFWGEDQVYLLVLSPTEVALHALGRVPAVAPQVRTLLEYFAEAKAIDNDPEGYREVASQIYNTFIAPAAAPENEALLILPDGLLGYLPFAALITSAEGGYLLERNPVSYAQSASVFGREMSAEKSGALTFTPFVTALPDQAEAPLPFSANEAAMVATYYSAEALTGAAATRTALLDSAAMARVLHLGTHAFASRTKDAAPRILTATDPLYLPDVYGLDVRGSLVTLSACQSNIGPLARGEGVLGLGRAFRAAGASGVVASLWSLNDRSAAEITATFYEHLAAGTPKPQALHQAQLDYLQRDDLPAYLKSPYYWAALTYYGDAGTMPAPGSGTLWWLVIGGVLVVALAWLMLVRR